MDINITLLIQIANFLIAYVIIRWLLLKPAVAVILQEEDHRIRLNETITAYIQENKNKEASMSRRWAFFRKTAAEHAPHMTTTQAIAVKRPEEELKVETQAKETLEPIAKEVTEDLVKRLRHVR